MGKEQFNTSPEDQDSLWPAFLRCWRLSDRSGYRESWTREEWIEFWLFFKAGSEAQEAMRLND